MRTFLMGKRAMGVARSQSYYYFKSNKTQHLNEVVTGDLAKCEPTDRCNKYAVMYKVLDSSHEELGPCLADVINRRQLSGPLYSGPIHEGCRHCPLPRHAHSLHGEAGAPCMSHHGNRFEGCPQNRLFF